MNIFEDGSYQINTEFPNEIFADNAVMLIPDGTPMAIKYMEIADKGKKPEIVIQNGEIVGIKEPEETDGEKRERYEERVNSLIREKYSMSEEFAICRKKFIGTISDEEFQEYSNYAENCKQAAKLEIYGEVATDD